MKKYHQNMKYYKFWEKKYEKMEKEAAAIKKKYHLSDEESIPSDLFAAIDEANADVDLYSKKDLRFFETDTQACEDNA